MEGVLKGETARGLTWPAFLRDTIRPSGPAAQRPDVRPGASRRAPAGRIHPVPLSVVETDAVAGPLPA